MSEAPTILVIEGRFYADIADELLRGACAELQAQGAAFEVVTAPGALEIPQVLSSAAAAGLFRGMDGVRRAGPRFAGAVALGCVIRGETSHYDIVAGESARALTEIAVTRNIAVGNGILTVENHEQALVRASVQGKNKGRDAVLACLSVVAAQMRFDREKARLVNIP